ncbi:MAG: hypothetical protein WBV94_10555 [Blastocatellia bacterium]
MSNKVEVIFEADDRGVIKTGREIGEVYGHMLPEVAKAWQAVEDAGDRAGKAAEGGMRRAKKAVKEYADTLIDAELRAQALAKEMERINKLSDFIGKRTAPVGPLNGLDTNAFSPLAQKVLPQTEADFRKAEIERRRFEKEMERVGSGAYSEIASGAQQAGKEVSQLTAKTRQLRQVGSELAQTLKGSVGSGSLFGDIIDLGGAAGGGPFTIAVGAIVASGYQLIKETERIREVREELLKFEESMANFGRRGGGKQIAGEVAQLIEARNALLDVANLGGGVRAQIEELNKAGLRKTPSKEELKELTDVSLLDRALAVVSNSKFQENLEKEIFAKRLKDPNQRDRALEDAGLVAGPRNQQELDNQILSGFDRFTDLQHRNQQTGRRNIFSDAERDFGLDVPKRNEEIDRLGVRFGDLSVKLEQGRIDIDSYKTGLRLLGDEGKRVVETLSRTKLAELEKAFDTREFKVEALERGIDVSALFGEKLAEIKKEAAAATKQLEEFNHAGADAGNVLEQQRKAEEQRKKLQEGADIALKRLERGLDGNNPAASILEQSSIRLDQFRKQFDDLGNDVIAKAEAINQKLTGLDLFKANIGSIEKIVRLQERLRRLNEDHDFEDAERKRKLEFGNRQASLETEIKELQRGSRFDEIEKAAETVRRLAQTPGLVGVELSKAIEEATRGLSIEQLRGGGLLHTRQDALVDIASSERSKEAFRKDPAEVRETRNFIAKARADFNEMVERAERGNRFGASSEDRQFAKTFDKARSQEILDREVIALTGRITPDKLRPDLRERERDAVTRQIERETEQRAQLEAAITQLSGAATQLSSSTQPLAELKQPILNFIEALAKGIGIDLTIKDNGASTVDLGTSPGADTLFGTAKDFAGGFMGGMK